MDAFTVVHGPAAPLMLPDVNTDVISPAHSGKSGMALSAFAPLRYLPDGEDDPSFVLNRKPFRKAPILLAAHNFGCGSSRESAVWSLRAIGITCVIATSFGDIFFGNCFQNGVESERALAGYGREQGMEVVVLRPPLVYGPGVRANFDQLMRAVERGVPLPLGAIDARRSMVYVGNLADAIRFVATRVEPTDGVFHVTDGDDLSVAQMIRVLAQAFDKPARLLPVPASWLRAAGALTGRSAQVDRLTSPLRMDSTRLRTGLGWRPPTTVAEGIARTVRAFQEARR